MSEHQILNGMNFDFIANDIFRMEIIFTLAWGHRDYGTGFSSWPIRFLAIFFF